MILTVVSPPRTSAAILRESRPSFGIAAPAATEKATGNAAGVATTEPAGRYDPRPLTAHPAVFAFAATTLVGFATGYAGTADPDLPAEDRPARPDDATAESVASPAGSPTLAGPGLWPFAALAEALPFAGALAFDADALSLAAQGLLGRLEAAAEDAGWDSGAHDFAWLSGAVAALGGAGYAARVTAARRRADAGPRSVLASWGAAMPAINPGDPAHELRDALGQLSRGELEVAEALFQAYSPYLRAIVRRQLSDRLRSRFDPSDVVQSVWVQVVRQLGRDGWPVGDEARVRGLLATIARRRLVSRIRKEDPATPVRSLGDDEPFAASPSRFPPASEVAQAAETWRRLVELCPPEHRAILDLRREGLKLDEIAARTGLHEGSVRRALRRLAQRLALTEQPLDDSAEAGDE